jgi:type I restriction enzyme S subunit
MSDQLPEGWKSISLRELVVHTLGGDWGKDQDEADPQSVPVAVIRGTEFRRWKSHYASTAAHRFIKASSLERRQLQLNDLVVEVSGGGPTQPVGRVLRIDDVAMRSSVLPLVCSNFCRQLRLTHEINAAYIQAVLQWLYTRGDFDAYQTQTTNLRNLDFSEFLGTEVPIPPLMEQNRIIEKAETLLEEVSTAKNRLERVQFIVERFRQTVLIAACSGVLTEQWRTEHPAQPPDGLLDEARNFVKNQSVVNRRRHNATGDSDAKTREDKSLPDSWVRVRLRETAIVLSGQTPKGIDSQIKTKGKYPWLKVGDMNAVGNERFMNVAKSWLTEDGARELSLRPLPTGTVIFPKRGGAIATNKKRILSRPSCVDLNTMGFIPFPPFSNYLWWWFKLVDLGMLSDGTSVPQINHPDIEELEVPIPPVSEQRAIVERVGALFNLADMVEKRLAAAQANVSKLPQTILSKAFRGKLVPTEADLARAEKRDFESADSLLERIQCQRERPGNLPPKGEPSLPRQRGRQSAKPG